MQRTLVLASLIAVISVAMPGSGLGSSAQVRGSGWMPAGLANAIHARLGAGAVGRKSGNKAQAGPAHLGFAVAVSADGTTALVGAVDAQHHRGGAFIFRASSAGSWSSSATPLAALTSPVAKPGQQFGFDVALSGDGTTAFVSAPGVTDETPAGAIYVFHVAAENAWASSSAPIATMTKSDDPLFGFALAVSADGATLLVGAPYMNSQRGGALVYHVASEDAWTSSTAPSAVLTDTAANPNDGLIGFSVAISGDGTLALLSNAFTPTGGGGDLYHASSADAWTSSVVPTAVLTDTKSVRGDVLGVGVALSGDGTVAFLGAPIVDGPESGYVDVYHSAGEAAWIGAATPTATLSGPGGPAGHAFGFDVAASGDGKTVLVEAPSPHAKPKTPYVSYIFRAPDEGSWVPTAFPTATLVGTRGRDGTGYDLPRDGVALSADGATALSGASGFRLGTGAADIFHVSNASSWPAKSKPAARLTNSALFDCVVPRLVGLKLSAAKAELADRDCRLGRVRTVRGAKEQSGRVVYQSRIPWARLPAGAKIAVEIER